MSLITSPQFPITSEAEKFVGGINNRWTQLAQRRLSLELEKSRLDGASVMELNKQHIQKRRANREALSELIREEITVLSDAEKWPSLFYSDRDRAAKAARTAYDDAIGAISEGLTALGVQNDRTAGVSGLWASHYQIAHQAPAVRQAMTKDGQNWKAMHPVPAADEIRRMIDEREKELRVAVEAAA